MQKSSPDSENLLISPCGLMWVKDTALGIDLKKKLKKIQYIYLHLLAQQS